MEPVIGVAVGQKRDPTAICVARSAERREGTTVVRHFTVHLLERLPLGRSYPQLADRLTAVVAGTALRSLENPEVYVHATGIGEPVVDFLRERHQAVTPVYFTHGDRRVVERSHVTIGKAWLVSMLQVLLQTHRLHLPRTAEAGALVEELLAYEIHVDHDANDRYGAFRVGQRDEMVTALGLAVQADPIPRAEWGRLRAWS